MRTVTKRVYNSMGDGYDEYIVMADEDGSKRIIYVGKFAYDDAYSSVVTTGMDKKGYRNAV